MRQQSIPCSLALFGAIKVGVKKKRLSTPSNNYIPFIERIFVNNEENGEFGYSVPNKENIGGT
jgi:hypothetical protein